MRAEHSFNPTRLCKFYTPKLSVRQSKTEHPNIVEQRVFVVQLEEARLGMATAASDAAFGLLNSSGRIGETPRLTRTLHGTSLLSQK